MQAVPTLELLSMEELNGLDVDDLDDMNLDMYLGPVSTGGGCVSSDGGSRCGVRENLKTHIQRKRRDLGELAVLTSYDRNESQDQHQQMSPGDDEKRQRRRQQNRRAARKFREKKKMHAQGIIQDYRRLQLENARFQRHVADLQRQKAELEEIIMQHSVTCQLMGPQSSLPSSDYSNIKLPVDTTLSYLQDLQFC